jgi:hypothetical protein
LSLSAWYTLVSFLFAQALSWILAQSDVDHRLLTLGLVKMGHRVKLQALASSLPCTERIKLESGDDVQALLKKLDLLGFWPRFEDEAIDNFEVRSHRP